ncbi:integrase [Vibrio harveyi]|uniref:site-specific integrase n=1 Tax=Vibrio harveyi TaxID=669 RepID=UPI0010FFBBE3|nr:site-specific integrase [Vibrio harveyi]GEA22194.1 integrase [Vibrio harveyi]
MREHAPIGRHHIVVKQTVVASPTTVFPILYLEGQHGYSIMWSLVEYFIAYASKSDSWMRDTARAVGLFYDFNKAYRSSDLDKTKQLRKFITSLEHGTIDTETHYDETGLYWAPTGLDKSKRLRTRLVAFIDWVDEQEAKEKETGKSDFKAHKKKNEKLALSLLKSARYIIGRSPMAHVKNPIKVAEKLSRSKSSLDYEFDDDPKTYQNSESETKSFPIELIAPLMQVGFIKDAEAENPFEREDITTKMITILLLFGGLRKGEPFHLWFNDIYPCDDFQCQAKLCHPRLAPTNLVGESDKTRQEYLKERRMRPRHDKMNPKSLKAGWKKLAVDKKTYHADVFFMHSAAEALFVSLYNIYLPYRRTLMETYIKEKGHDHPFLFVATGTDKRTGESYIGAPYSMHQFSKSYNKALDRVENHIGMKIERGRDSALNPHALRHCYAQLLDDMGVDRKVIQRCLHHRTINAQEAYKGISAQKVKDTLANYSTISALPSKLQLTNNG